MTLGDMTWTVVIADDDPLIRSALSDIVSDHPNLSVVGLAESGPAAAALCSAHHPNIAIVDVIMPGGGAEAITAIHAVSRKTAIVIYTARSDRRTHRRMTEAGAASVIVKGRVNDIVSELLALLDPMHGTSKAPGCPAVGF